MLRTRWERIGIGLLVIGLAQASAFAATVDQARGEAPALQSPSRAPGWLVFEKLGRGVGNFFFGWVEIPATIQRQYHEQDAPASFASGVLMGMAKAMGRTVVGMYETVTFLVPIPPAYKPVLPPLDYFAKQHPDWKLSQ